MLGKRPEHTHVVIDEIEPENRGFDGVLTSEYRTPEPCRRGGRAAANVRPT